MNEFDQNIAWSSIIRYLFQEKQMPEMNSWFRFSFHFLLSGGKEKLWVTEFIQVQSCFYLQSVDDVIWQVVTLLLALTFLFVSKKLSLNLPGGAEWNGVGLFRLFLSKKWKLIAKCCCCCCCPISRETRESHRNRKERKITDFFL